MVTVMIADDSKIMRFSISKLLKELDCKVVAEAVDGFDAIEKYKKYKPDLVTMDITMPEVNSISDGIVAVGEIMKINPLAKIVMLTSHGEHSKVINAIKSGAMGYLLKPVGKDKLEQILVKLIPEYTPPVQDTE